MELIGKEATLDALSIKAQEVVADANHNFLRGFMEAVDVVRHAEPKTGYWVPRPDGFLKCNLCEQIRYYPEIYCPNCGAKMEK